jgi:hypothetical protein
MLVACQLAGLSALNAYYADVMRLGNQVLICGPPQLGHTQLTADHMALGDLAAGMGSR